MAPDTNELQAINTSRQIAIQEILRMVIRDMYHARGEASFKTHIKRIEEAAVDSIYTDLRLRGTDEWTETLNCAGVCRSTMGRRAFPLRHGSMENGGRFEDLDEMRTADPLL